MSLNCLIGKVPACVKFLLFVPTEFLRVGNASIVTLSRIDCLAQSKLRRIKQNEFAVLVQEAIIYRSVVSRIRYPFVVNLETLFRP
jgi:hypothetical protein